MFYNDLPFDLDVTRHDAVFNPRDFNNKLVAIVGKHELLVPLFQILVRLGLQRFALYCDKDVSSDVRSVRNALEARDIHELEIHTERLSIEEVLAGPEAEVLFVLHDDYRVTSVLARILFSPLAAKVVFVPYWSSKGLRMVTLPTTDTDPYREGLLPIPTDGKNFPAILGMKYILAGLMAFALLTWAESSAANLHSLLPRFKPAVLSRLDYLATQKTKIYMNPNTRIDVIGLGALGSWIVYALLVAGFKSVRGFDADFVDFHNLPNQLYYRMHTEHHNGREGVNKALALAEVLKDYGLAGFTAVPRHADYSTDSFGSIVIVATDKVAKRAELYKRQDLGDLSILIDVRIGTGSGVIRSSYNESLSDRSLYAEALLTMKEPVQQTAGCHQLTLAPMGLIMAGMVLNHLGRISQTEQYGRKVSNLHATILSKPNFFMIVEEQEGMQFEEVN